MKYKLLAFKNIHCDDIETIPDDPLSLGITTLDGRGAKSDKGRLPIILTWRFRIFDNDVQTFTCTTDGYYILTFEYSLDHIKDIINMIEDSHIMFIQQLYEKSFNLKIDKIIIPGFDQAIKNSKAAEIIQIAKSELLLSNDK
jgi:hypothetical protein